MIKPYRIADDENTFMFLYVPQDATPVFNLKMSSGKSIAYTFDNSCHEYPGRIIKMTGIRIEEKTTDANILSLSGLNLTQWTSNGLPESAVIYPYVDLAGIGKVDTDEGNYNFFEAYLKKVTITSVDRTDPEVSSYAVHPPRERPQPRFARRRKDMENRNGEPEGTRVHAAGAADAGFLVCQGAGLFL